MSVVDALRDVFGAEENIPIFRISGLLRMAWQGNMCDDGIRALCWRVLLGLMSGCDQALWKSQLKQCVDDYTVLKERVMPSIGKVKDDPLSALSMGDHMSEEWNSYYKNVELINFIKGDLDRLFLTGLEDEYFQSKEKRELLTAILFIWSMEHPFISYRQGMHEILGVLLFVVERELAAWQSAPEHPLRSSFTSANVEAYTFALFDRLMRELDVLYDPLPVTGVENQPFVVQYCTKIQEHYLRVLDPAVCLHLEESYIQSQLYGLRWSRLLLGREFTLQNNQMLRLWDFMFASCYDAEFNSAETLLDDSMPPNVYSVLAQVRFQGANSTSNVGRRVNKNDKVTYVCTPLLGALGDFMLAMMVQVREELLEGDASTVMATLMRYPEQASVQPVLEFADMIRRGVLLRFTDTGSAVMNYQYSSMSPDSPTPPPQDHYRGSAGGAGGRSQRTPQSRTPGGGSSGTTGGGGRYADVGKKVSEKLGNLSSAVGAGLSDLVHAFTPLLESAFDDSPPASMHASYRTATTPPPPPPHAVTQSRGNSRHQLDPLSAAMRQPQQPAAADPLSTTEDVSDPLQAATSSPSYDPDIDPLTGLLVADHQSPLSSGSNTSSGTSKTPSKPISKPASQPTPSGSSSSSSSAVHTTTTTSNTANSNNNNSSNSGGNYGMLFGESDAQHHSNNTSSSSGKQRSGSLSLFKPREWFGASGAGTTHSTTASASGAAQGAASSSDMMMQQTHSHSSSSHSHHHHNNPHHHHSSSHHNAHHPHSSSGGGHQRLSAGFNMSKLFHGGAAGGAAGSEDAEDDGDNMHGHVNPVPLRKKNLIAQNHTVSDRLLDLADYLLQFSHTAGTSSLSTGVVSTAAPPQSTSDDTPAVSASVVTSPSAEDGAATVARRLRTLAAVLAGQVSVVDYDVKFSNRPLPPVLLGPALSASPVPGVLPSMPSQPADAATASGTQSMSTEQESSKSAETASTAASSESIADADADASLSTTAQGEST